VTPIETQLLFARAVLLILLYTLIAAVGIVAWLDLRAARKSSGAAQSRAEAPRLIVLEPAESDRPPGTAFPLQLVTSLGRDLDNDVVLADPSISGRHAVLSHRDRTWWLEDLGSTNGSFVNGDGVSPGVETLLRSGDLVQLGAVKMRLVTPGS
jgi:pSer/pThr/pTyr-binding forkhead associated (FHA) protein